MKNKVNRAFMAKKKPYIIPYLEVTDLRAINATMHAFNEPSLPSDPSAAPARRNGSKTEVF